MKNSNPLKSIGYNINDALNPENSVFVAAHAGAGKTSLLTRRVLRLLLEGVPPSKILCLTFTNAAAAEMQSRVLAHLGSWVMAKDEMLMEKLAELAVVADGRIMARARALFAHVLEAPEGVRIQTIHGFCQSLLRRFPIEAGLSPHFSVIDTRSEQELLHEARLRLFQRAQTEDGDLQKSIHVIAQMAGEAGLRGLLSQVISHKRRIVSWLKGRDAVEDAVQKIRRLMQVEEGVTVESLIAEWFTYDEATIAGWRRIVKIFMQGEEKDQAKAQALIPWFAQKDKRESHLEIYLNFFLTQKGEQRKSLYKKNQIADAELIELLKNEQERVWRFKDAYHALKVVEHTAHMLHVTEAFLTLYTKLKQNTGSMDYDDLILSACRLLEKSGVAAWVLYKLDGGIDHVLVDEAQDTSPEQWKIIDALTQEFFAGIGKSEVARSIFIVGDEKQSIFSFQGADPSGLTHMQRYFTQRMDAAHIPYHHILLDKSYRSTDEVLKAVDAVFSRSEAHSGLMFSEQTLTHIPTRLEHKGLVEVWPLVRPEGEDDENGVYAHTLLAQQLADRIKGWLADGVMLDSRGRALQPGDILILVRTRTRFVDSLVRALKRRGVPVAGHDRMSLDDNLAVQDALALGQALLLPEDDLNLACVLKSPFFGLSEEELFGLAWQRAEHSVWERLQQLADTSPAYRHACDTLTDLRARVDLMPPFELYSYYFDTLGARRKIIGRMGDEYNDPIDEFLGQALLYTRSHPPSMQGFLHWLTSTQSIIKRDMEQVKNMVRIMTVHGAKGLQAPVVIMPDTVQLPTMRDTLLWYHDGVKSLPVWPLSSSLDDAFCASLRDVQKQAAMEEYRRLMYVALTRAEDRLYIVGATSKEKINDSCWYNLIREGLAPIATPFEMGSGEALRLGVNPACAQQGEISAGTLDPVQAYALQDYNFLRTVALPEPTPSKPLTPSKLANANPPAASPLAGADVYLRGTFIHALLQYLPATAPEKQEALAMRLSRSYVLPPEIIQECLAEVRAVISNPDHAFLFVRDALAEVPVSGAVTIKGQTIFVSGQIDRLLVRERDVWIVDFKSNHMPPKTPEKIPAAYVQQLRLYQLLLQQIYPDKTIRACLLWTANASFTELPTALLDETDASAYI